MWTSAGVTTGIDMALAMVEEARALLSTTQLGTKTSASRRGFGSAPRMARAFERALGIAPRAYRLMFAPENP